MNLQVVNTIKDALDDIPNFTPEKLQNLIQETLSAFHSIQEKVTSKDEKEKEEGLKIAQELKATLEDQVTKLQNKLNMTPEQIEAYVANPANFSKQELKSMHESKQNLEKIENEIKPKSKVKASGPKKKARKQRHIVC